MVKQMASEKMLDATLKQSLSMVRFLFFTSVEQH